MQQAQGDPITRFLRARGLPCLDEPGVVPALAALIEDHRHFTELLRACDPELRHTMYEAVKPYLGFKAGPLEDYVIMAKERAEAARLPLIDEDGVLLPFRNETGIWITPAADLHVICAECGKEQDFAGERKIDAIYQMRHMGWAWDETVARRHLCPDCLEGSHAMDQTAGQTAA